LTHFSWLGDFARIPDEEWTRQPVDQFGLNADDVGEHGWYKNLEPTISQVLATLEFLQEYLFQSEEFLARISGSYGLGVAAEMARIGLAQPARAEEKV
jgi:hypothetical protein